ncbi:MAG: hypothetical protein ACREH8_10790 [Opitutaceae bacterium]
MQRRTFLQTVSLGAAASATSGLHGASAPGKDAPAASAPPNFDEWIRVRHQRVISAERLDGFFGPKPNNQWAQFDPELGYVPSDSIQRDGIDGSHTVYRYGPAGERRMINYAPWSKACPTCPRTASDGWQIGQSSHSISPIRTVAVNPRLN